MSFRGARSPGARPASRPDADHRTELGGRLLSELPHGRVLGPRRYGWRTAKATEPSVSPFGLRKCAMARAPWSCTISTAVPEPRRRATTPGSSGSRSEKAEAGVDPTKPGPGRRRGSSPGCFDRPGDPRPAGGQAVDRAGSSASIPLRPRAARQGWTAGRKATGPQRRATGYDLGTVQRPPPSSSSCAGPGAPAARGTSGPLRSRSIGT